MPTNHFPKGSRYTKEFMALRQAREEDDPNLPMGDWERPLIKADWNKISDKCIDFLQNNSKDLLVAVWLCDALIRTHQINGLRVGMTILEKLISSDGEYVLDGRIRLICLRSFIILFFSFSNSMLIRYSFTKVLISIGRVLNKSSIFVFSIKNMSLNKNKIFGYTALVMALLGTALILIGLLKYPEYAIGFSIAGVGFYAIAWAFNALKGRI